MKTKQDILSEEEIDQSEDSREHRLPFEITYALSPELKLSTQKDGTVFTLLTQKPALLNAVVNGPLFLARVWLSQYNSVFKGRTKITLRSAVLARATQGLVASDRTNSGNLTLYYASEEDRSRALDRLRKPICCQQKEVIVPADWIEPGHVLWHRFPIWVTVQYWTEATLDYLKQQVRTQVKEVVFHNFSSIQSLCSFTAYCNFKGPEDLLLLKGGRRTLEDGTWMELRHQGTHFCSKCRVYGHKTWQCSRMSAYAKLQWITAHSRVPSSYVLDPSASELSLDTLDYECELSEPSESSLASGWSVSSFS